MSTPTINRRCHWLRRNWSASRPEWIVFVDAESDQVPLWGESAPSVATNGSDSPALPLGVRCVAETHVFKTGWACVTRYTSDHGLEVKGWHKIDDVLEFWHVVSKLAVDKGKVWVVAHNMDYDARVLRACSILPGIGWSPEYFTPSDSCFFIRFKADKSTILLLDNCNYWRVGLATLGSEFGIEKLAIDFETATDRELSEYCKRDVEILVKVWQYWFALLDSYDLGDFAITIAGQSFRAFRHRFLPKEIGIHNCKAAIELERQAYKGGRCEVFRVGKFVDGPYYKLDINSSYPYAMQAYPVPRKLKNVTSDCTPERLSKLIEKYHVIADVLLDTDEPLYPIRSRGFTVFPTGQFRVQLTTWEVITALEKGHIKAIGKVALYVPAVLFKGYVDFFAQLRQEAKVNGDLARSRMFKGFLNSLYGKFGQRGYVQKVVDDAPLDEVSVRHIRGGDDDFDCWIYTFGGKVIYQEKRGEAEDSFPGIAAHVTAAARMVLWDYVQKAGEKNVFYADTDSLIVNQAGYDVLKDWIDPLELGKLKVQGVSDDLEIYAKKSYIFDGETTTKGISKKAVRTEEGLWRQTHFTSIRAGFRYGSLDNVITYEVEKHVRDVLTYGTVGKDGWVRPPVMSLLQEDVVEIVKPIDWARRDWWVDVAWLGTLRGADVVEGTETVRDPLTGEKVQLFLPWWKRGARE